MLSASDSPCKTPRGATFAPVLTMDERLAAERRRINKVCDYGPPHINDFSAEWAGCTGGWRPTCWTYSLFSPDDSDNESTLLYIGVSEDWRRRLAQHRQTKSWWHEVDVVHVQQHCCRSHALMEEAFEICDSEPRYNIARPHHVWSQAQVTAMTSEFYQLPDLALL